MSERSSTPPQRSFLICKDHQHIDWNQPTLDDEACILCRLFYLEAQESLLEEWQQRAKRAEDTITEIQRPLDAQMARLNATVARLNDENEKLRAMRSESVALNPAILPALPGQKALTVTMLKDDGDVQADAAVEAIKAGTSTFHVTNPSRLFFHHLRLRVALEPALAEKIAVYYLTDDEDPNKRWRLVGLGKDDQLRWPPNFELDLWEKESQISAVGGHPVPGGRAEEIATALRRKYGC